MRNAFVGGTGGLPAGVVPAVVVWAVAAIAGLVGLVEYAGNPGPRGVAAAAWPDTTDLAREPGRATLVMALHPECPCSFASVSELARLMTAAAGRVVAHVLVVQPGDDGTGWTRTRSTALAATMPAVRLHVDPHGAAARAFGAATSGHVVLYNADGLLRFSGGITAARGHEGDNAGRDRVLHLLTDPAAPRMTAEVYGCELLDPTDAPCPCAGSSRD